jgi:curli biogenesis system outer membrane secretion channel CsgG
MNLQDFVTPEMVAALVSAFGSVLIALAAYGATLARQYVASKTSETSFAFLKAQAATAVKWLEQSPAFTGAEGAQKKETAVVLIMQIAEKAGIPMTTELADQLIEEAVFDLKQRADKLVDAKTLTALAASH